MGSGVEVSKAASDIVIADNNLSTIIKAIAEGRHIQQSIKKFVVQLLTGNSSEVTVLLFGLLFQDSADQVVFPLSPLQILALNMITSSLIAIALSVETIDPQIMKNKPETANFLTPEVLIDTAIYGSVVSALSFLSYYSVIFWFHDNATQGFPVSTECNKAGAYQLCRVIWHARSTVYATMSMLLLFAGYVCRDARKSIFRMKPLGNKTMIFCILAGGALLVPFLYIPWIADNMFQHAPIGWEWSIVGVALVVFIVASEVYKFFKRLFYARMSSKPLKALDGTEMVNFVAATSDETQDGVQNDHNVKIHNKNKTKPIQKQQPTEINSSTSQYAQINDVDDEFIPNSHPSSNNIDNEDNNTLDGLGSSIVLNHNDNDNYQQNERNFGLDESSSKSSHPKSKQDSSLA
jgi:hypothetical protein